MLKKIRKIFRNISIVIHVCYHMLIHIFQRKYLTPQGERLKEYLFKVVCSNYEPETMTDYQFEETLNPDKLTGAERMKLMYSWYLNILSYPSRKEKKINE